MCLAVPAKITAIEDSMATVTLDGVSRRASLMLLPEAKLGDFVLVHAGFAMEIVDEHLAMESQALWREMGGAGRDGELQETIAQEIAGLRPSAEFIAEQKR
ncbi:MAG: HypC/HybG/HupF family hydrogenase formation chaperone [Selenomonadaceae bacterium]|nr:HypC/HybG/HupF family hydrogenase formation chaperone [Selenomonadaceae bacterium]